MTSSWSARTSRTSPPVRDQVSTEQVSTERGGIVSLLARFGRELRAAGMAVGSGDIISYCAAMTELDPADLVDVYWAGRCVLVSRRDDIAVYDRVFRRFFLGEEDPVAEVLRLNADAASQVSQSALVVPANEPGPDEEREESVLGLMASGAETLRHKAFAACTPEELAAVRRIMARIRLTPPRRRTRRTAPARRGSAIDLRRMVQAVHAHARRARGAVLAGSQAAATAADPDPGCVWLDGRLLPQSAPVRLFREAGGGQGRGVLLRDQAHQNHQGARSSQAG